MNLPSLRFKLSYRTMMNKIYPLKRAMFFCGVFCSLGSVIIAQTISYRLTSKEKAFMCPFLTPVFMNELTKAGAEDIHKDDKLIIHFDVPMTSSLDSVKVYRIASEVGFLPSFFTLEKTEK
jgi:hypothetical protein